MTTTEFQDKLSITFNNGLALIKRKNADYANSTNPFRNFESASIVGLSVERAILVRVLDKLSRVSNLLDKPPAVSDEAITDTLLDMINYAAILKVYIESKANEQPPVVS